MLRATIAQVYAGAAHFRSPALYYAALGFTTDSTLDYIIGTRGQHHRGGYYCPRVGEVMQIGTYIAIGIISCRLFLRDKLQVVYFFFSVLLIIGACK